MAGERIHAVDDHDDGSLAAVLNRLADGDVRQVEALDRLSNSIESITVRIDGTFVPQRVYDEREKARDAEVAHLATAIARLADSITWAHRSTWTSVVFPLLMVVAGVVAGVIVAMVVK
jgi:hypothetical protein